MSDDLEQRGPQDHIRINIHDEHELRYWTRELNLTPDASTRAVEAVGVMAEDVRRHVEKYHPLPIRHHTCSDGGAAIGPSRSPSPPKAYCRCKQAAWQRPDRSPRSDGMRRCDLWRRSVRPVELA